MIYQTEMVIPQNTPQQDPVISILDCAAGVVTQVWVRWRWGAGNLAGVRIRREGVAIWPYNMDGWFNSSSLETTWNEYYVLDAEPYSFTIEGYNEDDTFPHTVTVMLNLQRPTINDNLVQFLQYVIKGM